ncbi:hypothetical protein BJX65DRAFT_277996 [Aspergillus insuetus]
MGKFEGFWCRVLSTPLPGFLARLVAALSLSPCRSPLWKRRKKFREGYCSLGCHPEGPSGPFQVVGRLEREYQSLGRPCMQQGARG